MTNNEEKLPLCECGCGKPVTKLGNRYIAQHHLCKKKQSQKHIAKRIKSTKENKLNPKPKLEALPCECGCGELAEPGKRFISGHNRRGGDYWKRQQEPQLCGCGCGEYANPGMEFIKGHHNRCQSDKTRSRMSESHKDVPLSPEHCNAMSEASKNSDAVKAAAEAQRGGEDIVKHHYIYDESDLSKYTMKMTRSAHARLHNNMRKAGIKIPHINVKEVA